MLVQFYCESSSFMKPLHITTALLIGAFALILLAPKSEAARPSRGGGTITPPPQPPPVVSKL